MMFLCLNLNVSCRFVKEKYAQQVRDRHCGVYFLHGHIWNAVCTKRFEQQTFEKYDLKIFKYYNQLKKKLWYNYTQN